MRLSICIPTYNFGSYIGATLESILAQAQEGVEVVVLDGGSTDETTSVIESLQRRYSCLRYERRDERGGIDRDIARAVDMASGEYCWLFCADDVMKPGAIEQMLQNLESGCDVYLCGLTLCTLDMRPMGDHRISSIETASEFDLTDSCEREVYFSAAQTTTAFFSFAGSVAFKKSRWDEIGLDEEFVGSLWALAARLFQMIPRGLRLHYTPTSYLFKRTENDSFVEKGLLNRYSIAIDGYYRLAEACFLPGSRERDHIRRVVRNEFPPWMPLRLRFTDVGDRPEDLAELNRLVAKAYGDRTPRNLVYRAIYKYTPRWTFRAAQAANHTIRSIVNSIERVRTTRGARSREALS